MDINPLAYTGSREAPALSTKPRDISLAAGDEVILTGSNKENRLLAQLSLLREQALAGTAKSEAPEAAYKKSFVNDFVNAQQVDMKVQELAVKFPNLLTVVTRDYQTSGYDGHKKELQGPAPLRYLRIGPKDKNNDKKVGVLLTAAPHAREVMQPMIMLETLQQLLENYNPESEDPRAQEITELLNSVDIYMVVLSNPDGLNFALYDDSEWRKTRCEIPGSEEKGVDCNRNYDYMWEERDPARSTYSGPYPFSEPETRNVKEIQEEHPNIKFVGDFHSSGEEIRRPSNITRQDDLEKYIKFQTRIQQAIKSSRGREYEVIESNVRRGSSDDYFYFEKGAFSFVIEDGKEYKPSREEALEVVAEAAEGAKEILRIARDYGNERSAT